MTALIARFDGKVLIPDEPVDLPQGCALRIQVEAIPFSDPQPLRRLADLAGRVPAQDGLSDGAAEHDHYLYGVPKQRKDPIS